MPGKRTHGAWRAPRSSASTRRAYLRHIDLPQSTNCFGLRLRPPARIFPDDLLNAPLEHGRELFELHPRFRSIEPEVDLPRVEALPSLDGTGERVRRIGLDPVLRRKPGRKLRDHVDAGVFPA